MRSAREGIEHDKTAHEEDNGQVERYLGAVGRQNKQDVALVRAGEMPTARAKERQQPEQKSSPRAFHRGFLDQLDVLDRGKTRVETGQFDAISVAKVDLATPRAVSTGSLAIVEVAVNQNWASFELAAERPLIVREQCRARALRRRSLRFSRRKKA